MADELFKYDAIDLSELIRKGEITSAELLETTIHRELMRSYTNCMIKLERLPKFGVRIPKPRKYLNPCFAVFPFY